MGRFYIGGELGFEGGDLRALRHPPREHRLPRRLGFRFLKDRLSDRNHDATAFSAVDGVKRCRSNRH
jgi:hypothetical protein